ncbi:MAG: DUF4105 domain-containing protein [Bacteroidales bacterium]|nr:DUF4105 domain-containing protein [Candidatus Sodaliphilus fimicaballi]
MRKFNYIFLLMTIAMSAQVAKAQGDSVSVKLVTFYPGNEVFSIYGHSEVRVTWQDNDWYFNYGVFDFNEPGFVMRFVLGNADYLCVAMPQNYAMHGMDGRRMVEQELNLTQQQAVKVKDFLINNVQPENCKYRYQYLGDNCATRPRDIIEMAVGDSLMYPAMTDTVTYRDMMSHYSRNYPWNQFGVDLVLGADLDKPLTYRQQMFIPMVLMNAVGGATTMRDGVKVPLVSNTQVLIDGSEDGIVEGPTPWFLTPLAAALVLLTVVIAITIKDLRSHRVTRWLDFGICTVYSMAGLIIFFLMFVSVREATFPNYNALWVNPFYLLPIMFMWSERTRKALKCYYAANAAVIACTMLAWPFLPQVANVAFFPLMIVPVLRALPHLAR